MTQELSVEQIIKERKAAWLKRMEAVFAKVRHKDLRIIVDLYYQAQKHRIAQGNRIFAYRTMKLIQADTYKWYVDAMKANEKRFAQSLKVELEKEPIWKAWLSHVKGIGPVMGGDLIAWIDDPGKFETVSALWRYCGLAVIDGKVEKKVEGQTLHYSPKMKVLCWKVGGQLLKAKGPYYQLYLQFRKQYEARDDIKQKHELAAAMSKSKTAKLTLAGYKAHVSNMAQRKMVKIFISHLWEEWRELEHLPVTKPYAIDNLGHTNYLDPDDFVEKDYAWSFEKS